MASTKIPHLHQTFRQGSPNHRQPQSSSPTTRSNSEAIQCSRNSKYTYPKAYRVRDTHVYIATHSRMRHRARPLASHDAYDEAAAAAGGACLC